MTKIQAFVEITSGNIRLGPDTKVWGDPYDRFVNFVVTDNRTAVLKGWVGPPEHEHRRAIQRALAPLGLTPGWQRARHLTSAKKRAKMASRKRRHP